MSVVTELDRKLLEIAAANPHRFIAMIGEEAWLNAKICLLKRNKKSYGEIALKLSVTRRKVQYSCNKCDDSTDASN